MEFDSLAEASIIIMNNAGDIGSPCLTPYVEEKKPKAFLLMITKNEAPDIQALIHLHHDLEKPIF